MVNWHLPEQSICVPLSRDHFGGWGLELIEVTFFKLAADQVLVFDWIEGSKQG